MKPDTAGDVAMRVLQLDRDDELYNCTVQLVLAAQAVCGLDWVAPPGSLLEVITNLRRALKPFEEP